jgi:hypothetical protein
VITEGLAISRLCYDVITMNWLDRLEGWLAVPHELLHVAAYRLLGKRCRYTPGSPSVSRAEPLTVQERLFVLLLPTLVSGSICVIFIVGWTLSAFTLAKADPLYPQQMPWWHVGLMVMFAVTFIYTSAGWADLLIAVDLLRGRQKPSDDPPDERGKQLGKRQRP